MRIPFHWHFGCTVRERPEKGIAHGPPIDVTELILAGAGYSVRATADGFEALRWLEEEAYDLLILDLKMPEIDGPTIYREVRSRWPAGGPRALFVSGFADTSGYERALEALRVPVLVKPFTLDEISEAVSRALRA